MGGPSWNKVTPTYLDNICRLVDVFFNDQDGGGIDTDIVLPCHLFCPSQTDIHISKWQVIFVRESSQLVQSLWERFKPKELLKIAQSAFSSGWEKTRRQTREVSSLRSCWNLGEDEGLLEMTEIKREGKGESLKDITLVQLRTQGPRTLSHHLLCFLDISIWKYSIAVSRSIFIKGNILPPMACPPQSQISVKDA